VSLLSNIQLMGRYNQWMNARLYEAAGKLPITIIKEDQKAFFGSIHGTLNHLMVGDILWLKRFAAHPSKYPALDFIRQADTPTTLKQILYEDFAVLSEKRAKLDLAIVAWTSELAEPDLKMHLTYHNTKGEAFSRVFGSLILHLFNHQTHHRGQVTTLLFQSGVDVGVTDLLALIPDVRHP